MLIYDPEDVGTIKLHACAYHLDFVSLDGAAVQFLRLVFPAFVMAVDVEARLAVFDRFVSDS